MKAVVYDSPLHYKIKDVLIPELNNNQVLIKVKSCGICKTDVHIHHGNFISRFPLTPGHEFSGIVEKIGSNVEYFKEGDRVTADNTVLCGDCYYCRRNQPLYCENFYSLGVNGPGGFAEYIIVNKDKIFSISNKLSFDEAAFTEPTACAIHGMDVIDVNPADDILLFGSGPTGIILAQLLKYGGAGNIVVSAPTKFKLELIEKMGIAKTVLFNKDNLEDHEKKIKSIVRKGFDIIIDATGASSVVEHCFQYLKLGSKIVLYGVCNEKDYISINPYQIFSKEIKIIGSFAQTHCFDRAIKVLENGIVKVKELITHRFSLDEYEIALNTVINGKNNLKVIINP